MNIKKIIMVGLVAAASLALGEVAVTGVTAKQRYPWNGLVDITVTLSGTEEECSAATFPFYVTNKTTRANLPIGSVKAVGAIAGADNTWTRRFVWNATADVGCAKFGEVELTVGAPVTDGVQLWENGPYWAECNVGASQPEEAGYYFWWGDVVGYKRSANTGEWISVKDSSSHSFMHCPTSFKSNSQLQSEGYIDATGNLVVAHDAAAAHLGALWRMPTEAEFDALISNCTTTWTSWNDIPGLLVSGKGAYSSKSIFFPAPGSINGSGDPIGIGSWGCYWSSTPDSDDDYSAECLDVRQSGLSRGSGGRGSGRSIRPVRGFAQ